MTTMRKVSILEEAVSAKNISSVAGGTVLKTLHQVTIERNSAGIV